MTWSLKILIQKMMKILGTSKNEYKLHLLRIEKNIQLLYDIGSVSVFFPLIILKSAKFTLKGLFF
jgi:hypothetical protein